jgi:hypothetical protein
MENPFLTAAYLEVLAIGTGLSQAAIKNLKAAG